MNDVDGNLEFEKMIRGENYNAMDPLLVKMRNDAELIYKELNLLHETDIKRKEELFSNLFNKIGNNFYIESPFYCDYGKNTYLGDNVRISSNCVILDVAKVLIGNNCIFGKNVQIYTAAHPIDPIERNKGIEFGKEIIIGQNVYLGDGVILCPGVIIGDNVKIGPGSVVTKNIPSNSNADGNPCKIKQN